MKLGKEEAARGDAEAALSHYRAAQALAPEANLPYRYADEALEELSRWAEAVESYEKYRRTKADVSDAVQVKARVAYLHARYLLATLHVACTLPDYRVYFDDAKSPLFVAPISESSTPIGDHEVTLSAEGFLSRTTPVKLEAGRMTTVPCDLDPLPKPATARVAPSLATHPTPAIAEPPPHGRIPWLGWGLAGGFAVGAVVTGTLALNASSEVDERLRAPVTNADDVEQTRTRGRTLAITTDVLIGASVVSAAVSLAVMLSLRAKVSSERGAREQSGASRF